MGTIGIKLSDAWKKKYVHMHLQDRFSYTRNIERIQFLKLLTISEHKKFLCTKDGEFCAEKCKAYFALINKTPACAYINRL